VAVFFCGHVFYMAGVFLIYTVFAFRFCLKVVYVNRMPTECLELLPVWSAVGYLHLGIEHYEAKQFES
jgi:hypothetical protein